MSKPDKPLTNQQRVEILSAYNGVANRYLADQEQFHFGATSQKPRRLRELFPAKLDGDVFNGAFDDIYDDYLLALWDEMQEPAVPAGGPGGPGSPIGLLLALTQAQEGAEAAPAAVNISSGQLITTIPAVTYANDVS